MSEPGGFLSGAEKRRQLEEENERLRTNAHYADVLVADLGAMLTKATAEYQALEKERDELLEALKEHMPVCSHCRALIARVEGGGKPGQVTDTPKGPDGGG